MLHSLVINCPEVNYHGNNPFSLGLTLIESSISKENRHPSLVKSSKCQLTETVPFKAVTPDFITNLHLLWDFHFTEGRARSAHPQLPHCSPVDSQVRIDI